VLVALLGATAAVGIMGMTSTVSREVGPGTVSLGARAATEGATDVALPPFGVVSALTHPAPVHLGVRVDALDVEAISGTFGRPRPRAALEEAVRADIGPLLRAFARRALFAGMAVGAVVGLLVPRRRWSHGVAGALGGVLGVGAVLGLAWVRYDVDAFEEATFHGALERAPTVLAALQSHLGGLDALGDRVRFVSQQVAGLYAAADPEPVGADDTLILHVSDIHSNPLGIELTARLAESFGVDAVLDTGDLTSFGLPVEARIVDLIDDIDVPYLLVPGNHDSAENRASLAATPAVTLLDEEVAQVADLRILGVGDPTYTADNRITTAEANEVKLSDAERVARLVREEEPDLLAVHDLRHASAIRSRDVPMVVAGHTHARSEERRGGTLLLTVGSTGATGLGTYLVESDVGYEAQVLRYRDQRLTAIDYVTLSGVSGGFGVDRRVLSTSEADAGQPLRVLEGPPPPPAGSPLLAPFVPPPEQR
jgi:predicted phosphodiesterase